MKTNTVVTCLFNCSAYSRIGGRGYGFAHYLAPFINLLHLDANLVIYTEREIEKQLVAFFKQNNFKDFKIVIHDLNSYRHSDKIYYLKEREGIIDDNGLIEGVSYFRNDRNHHICLSKTHFVTAAINERYFVSRNTFWVDAGLFHHGLIPESLGGMERLTIPDSRRLWPENTNSVCNPNFFLKLEKKTPKDLTFLGIRDYHGRPTGLDEVFKEPKLAHIVGGLFGGVNDAVRTFCCEFEEKVDCLFEKDILSLEEEVLSGVFADKFSDQGYLAFTHWSHDKPEEPNHLGAPPGSDSFYKLFL